MIEKRLIIAGSRDFNNYEVLKRTLDKLLGKYHKEPGKLEIVSGRARGADQLGERYAKEHELALKQFPAQWNRSNGSYDRAAGYKRNLKMAIYATHCLVFWDGISKGTGHMISIALNKNLPVIYYNFNGFEIRRWPRNQKQS